jgi:hypothetical protein
MAGGSSTNPVDMDVTVLFPMAGRGQRFGGVFKPFLRYGDELFIEAAVRPFRAWAHRVRRFGFIYLEEQEVEFDVRAQLTRRFAGLPFDAIVLPEPTRGPAETFARAVALRAITGPVVICDCDHSLDVGPLFERRSREDQDDKRGRKPEAPPAACTIPTWSLDGESIDAWSVAAVGPDGRVRAIAETRRPDAPGELRGVIGCYQFADAADVSRRAAGATNLSEVIAGYLAEGREVRAVAIDRAEFFGDPDRLARQLAARAT